MTKIYCDICGAEIPEESDTNYQKYLGAIGEGGISMDLKKVKKYCEDDESGSFRWWRDDMDICPRCEAAVRKAVAEAVKELLRNG